MLRYNILDKNIAACNCCCTHKCSCFNLVRYNRICCAVKLINTFYSYYICTCAFYVSTHTVKQISYINHMWFLRCILYNCVSFCKYCGKHNVNRSSHRLHIKVNMPSYKPVSLSCNHSICCVHFSSHSLKTVNMLVYRSGSDITASRKCNMRLPVFSKKRTKQII